ncbi:hypothetical protein NM208_g475 [Fusarium decemcellulare]|uniref:Uncharacterized protein n=1 Tax=Fusarium decemcellulare TaxID=57161 RepID=A0ACC1SZM3_9HYPO|nr:hypothetical protein NM208_g475 [Fusarium decemcellulare]
MPPNSRFKKHTKTFSGCWTCRARKVKCDEARPRCRQCRRKGTECEGYGVRLQWVNDNGDADPPYLITPRSAISPDPHRRVIPYSQVNQILTRLDSLGQRRKTVPQNGVSLYLDCFGVFATGIDNSPTLSQEEASQPIPDSPLVVPEIDFSVDTSPLFNFAEDALAISSWQSPSPDILGDGQGFPFELPAMGLLSHVDSNPWSLSDTILSEFGAMENVGLQLQNYQHSSTVTSFSLLPTPTHLSNNERFLMYHYSQRVIYIFCVIDHEKSPWKTIHLPKALQATGELSIQGSTSIIRKALTNTLLGISAYLLCNETKSQLRTDEALTWKSAADTYRGKAITLLRDAVEQDLYSKSPPKYKDFLATTLSMITMNVISGNTATCGIHLDGAYRLITQAQKWKRKYSHKAQALHRIYFYLRTIYESTVPLHLRSNRRGFSAAKPTTKIPCEEPDVYCRSLLRDQMRGYESKLSLELDTRITNCERIYGIPHSLLFLLAQVIDLIDKIHDARDPASSSLVPDELVE